MIFYLQWFFFFNDTATTEIYTLSLPDALPISVIDTEVRVMGSKSLLTKVATKLKLAEDPEFNWTLVERKPSAKIGRAHV